MNLYYICALPVIVTCGVHSPHLAIDRGMKRLLLIIGFLAGIWSLNQAQQSHDYGLFLGMAQEHQHSILPWPYPGSNQLAAGAYYRYNLNPRYSLRFGAQTQPADPSAFDAYGLFEFNFLPIDLRKEDPQVSTFLGAGIGYYHLDKTAIYRNITIPFHIGVKYQANPRLGMTVEWALRQTPLGQNPVLADSDITARILSNWHSYIGITAGYTFLKTCKSCPFYESARKRR